MDELKEVGQTAARVGLLGVIIPFAIGAAWAISTGYDTPKATFIGAAFVATSAGITARVLQEMGMLARTESRVILGAAVIDDILAMLLLGVVTALQTDNGVDVVSLLLVLVQAIGFIAVITLVGRRIMRRSSSLLELPINPLSPLTLSLALCLGLAFAASSLGLAAIIGAFLAGMIAAETEQRHTLAAQLRPITSFLVPFFFVMTGVQVNLLELASASTLVALFVATTLAIAGKLFGCGLGAWSLGRKSALIVGVGMGPARRGRYHRGESRFASRCLFQQYVCHHHCDVIAHVRRCAPCVGRTLCRRACRDITHNIRGWHGTRIDRPNTQSGP